MNKFLVAFALVLATVSAEFNFIETGNPFSFTPSRGFEILGPADDQELGYTVSNAGDFNGDGNQDIALATTKGVVYVVFGNITTPRYTPLDLASDTETTQFITLTAPDGSTNIVVGVAGNIDRDPANCTDLIIGIPGAAGGDGEAYVVYGRVNATDITIADVASDHTQGFQLVNPLAGAALGTSVSPAMDIDADGVDDCLVSAPGVNTVYVIHGLGIGGNGVQRRTTNVNLQSLGIDGYTLTGAPGSGLGSYVAYVGDVDGDDFNDTVVGAAPGNVAYIVYGSNGFANIDFSTANAALFTTIAGPSSNPDADFGFNVGLAGDVNADGRNDIFIGAPSAAPGATGSTRTNAGQLYIIYGQDLAGDAKIPNINVDSLGTAGIVISGGAAESAFGWEADGVGDVNGDGVADLIVSAPGSEFTRASNPGEVYVIFGKTTLANIDLNTAPAADVGVLITGPADGDNFGVSLSSVGDINGDGVDDFIIASPLSTASITNPNGVTIDRPEAGVVYYIFGQTNSALKLGASLSVLASFLIALIL